MGSFRFRKQFNIIPGLLKLNLNKNSVSVTAGVRGAHVTVNSKGQRTMSAGIPGTGLSYRDTRKVGTKPTATQPKAIPAPVPASAPEPESHELWTSEVNGTVLSIVMTEVGGSPGYFLNVNDGTQRQTVGSWWDIMTATTAGLQWESYLRNGGTLTAWLESQGSQNGQ